MKLRVLAEYADEEWAEKFLMSVSGAIDREMVRIDGFTKLKRPTQPLIPDELEGRE